MVCSGILDSFLIAFVGCIIFIIYRIHIEVFIFLYSTAQKMKFSIEDIFSKCDQMRSFLRI